MCAAASKGAATPFPFIPPRRLGEHALFLGPGLYGAVLEAHGFPGGRHRLCARLLVLGTHILAASSPQWEALEVSKGRFMLHTLRVE